MLLHDSFREESVTQYYIFSLQFSIVAVCRLVTFSDLHSFKKMETAVVHEMKGSFFFGSIVSIYLSKTPRVYVLVCLLNVHYTQMHISFFHSIKERKNCYLMCMRRIQNMYKFNGVRVYPPYSSTTVDVQISIRLGLPVVTNVCRSISQLLGYVSAIGTEQQQPLQNITIQRDVCFLYSLPNTSTCEIMRMSQLCTSF